METGPRLSASDVKREAARLGFQPVGIASADRFAEAEAFLLAWLRDGRQAEMGWLDEQRAVQSCRPAELLEGARSLVVVGAAYGHDREPAPAGLQGRVARYARGLDYHEVMTARLRELGACLAELAGRPVRWRAMVDSSPLVDRAAAARAGLGFFGKNTCLIAPGAGSFVLIGALLTDLELAADPPLQRDCGSCRLCLDACPTGALTEPFKLDARLCVSYLTIELRGWMPPELRPAIGQRVFGCDDCQEICPWNQGRGPIPWPELAPEPDGRRDLELTELLELDQAAFSSRFRGTPLKRAKRAGLLRNAAIALGNAGDQRAIPGLARALLEDPDPIVRGHAAWALHRVGGPAARQALARVAESELDAAVLAEIHAAGGEALAGDEGRAGVDR